MMNKVAIYTAVTGGALALVSAAPAAEYEAQFDGVFGEEMTITLDGETFQQEAGVFNWTVVDSSAGTTPNFASGQQLATFCSDLTQFVGSSYDGADLMSMTDTSGEPMSTLRASLLSELFGKHYQDATSGEGSLKAQKTKAAAFQLAVWEIAHEDIGNNGPSLLDDLNIKVGDFAATQLNGEDDAVNLANAWLNDLSGAAKINDNLFGWVSGSNQNQLVFVPLPAPIALAGAGLVAIGLARRRLGRMIGAASPQ